MEKIEMSYLQFADVMELLKDDYRFANKEMLIKEFEKLKNKVVAEENRQIENPSIEFLFNAVEQARTLPDYSIGVKDFLETDIVSNTFKEYIFNMLKGTDTDIELLALLQSEASFNEFTKEQIEGIKKELDKLLRTEGVSNPSNDKICGMFNDYIFQLNGEGPVNYIKGLFTEQELAREFLTHSGMKTDISYYANRGMQRIDLNERHLMSIYKKFDKFMPEKKMHLYLLIKNTPQLNGADFIANYFKFIANNFDSEIEYSFRKRMIDYRGMSRIQIEDEELHRYNENKNHELIVSNFFGKVYKYERDKSMGKEHPGEMILV